MVMNMNQNNVKSNVKILGDLKYLVLLFLNKACAAQNSIPYIYRHLLQTYMVNCIKYTSTLASHFHNCIFVLWCFSGMEQWNVQKHWTQSCDKCRQSKNVDRDVFVYRWWSWNQSSGISDARSLKNVQKSEATRLC